VLSVAAIDVANMTTNPQEPFSSEGPVLASGGALPGSPNPATDPNLKPDLASFDHVTTVTLGASAFYGTSAATPHAAGMAALFMQRFGVQASAANLTSKIVAPLQAIANTGSNDLGAAGKDYQYGNGRLRFQKDASLAFIQQPGNTLVNTAIAPAVKIGIYDSEGGQDLYTLFDAVALAIANDPHGGSAVLSGGGSGALTLGAATYPAAKINLGGNGYTLMASASAAATPPLNLSVTSNPFNITTGTATKLAFTVQPSTVVAGHAISPAVQVSVEDSNGNVVNSASNYAITLKTVSCSSVVPTGGGPVTTSAAVATFAGVVLNKAATGVQLQATASGLSSATSSAFNVTANSDYVFRGVFETCFP
jgi:Subtilase family